MVSVLAHSFVLAPILAVLVYNLFNHEYARRHFVWFAGAGAVWQMLSALACALALRAEDLASYPFSILWNRAEGTGYFELSELKLFLLFVIGLVALVAVLIAKSTIDPNRSAYTNLLMILLLGMNGMLLVTDLFSLYVFMEVTGICCFVMIAMFRTRSDLEGSFKYLVMSELASVFLLTGLAFLFMKTGSLYYNDLRGLTETLRTGSAQDRLAHVSLVLLLSGFAIKTGVAPFHSWLPDARQSADTSVSVLLSGIVIKIAGVYGLMTVSRLFGEDPAVRVSLAALGVVTILVGALLAGRQKHFKRVVAYSSVSQMGYILLALSTGTSLGLVAALAHIFSHAVFKSTLFANAAALHEQAGSLDLADLGGLEERMPQTAFSSVVAFLSTAGIPPTMGFWSKLLILLALWSSGQTALAAVALIASILTASYLIRVQKCVFFGKIRESLSQVQEIGGTVLSAELLLTAVTLGVGLLYPLILVFLRGQGIL